jgi:hypothetical protein
LRFKRGSSEAQPSKPVSLGSNSHLGASSPRVREKMRMASKKDGFVSESRGEGSSAGSIQIGSVDLGIDMSPLMEGFDFDHPDKVLFNLYRDIYHHDPVSGSATDMYATLPFSEFSIGGADDKFLAPYKEAVEMLNLRTAMPEITTDHLVTGSYISSMLYSKGEKRFIDLMNHRLDNAEITPLPFYSQDPIINMKIPETLKSTLALDSPRIHTLKKKLGKDFVQKLESGNLELDPLGTIYLPRKTFSFGEGTSWYRRIVPLYLIEKNLFRGTLVESGKRQRGIMHLQMGDGDQWEPSVDEMEFMTDLFQNADLDPLGAIVATRLGVAVDELRQGGDFWKVTDLWDQTSTFKLRALGISEAFLSGEATYANMEGSLTVFIESMKAFRDSLTRRVFYDKVFPLVSMLQGYAINSSGKIRKESNLMGGDIEDKLRIMQNGSKLFIPTVHWSKQLSPEADQNRMDMLRGMQELGVPVPLRALAAAGGFNLDTLLMNQAEDLSLQRQILKYGQTLESLKKKYAVGGDDFDSESSVMGPRSSILGGKPRPNFSTRDYGESSEVVGRTKTGKRKWIYNQKLANDKANDDILKALSNITDNKKTPLTHRNRTPKEPSLNDLKALKKSGL